MLQIAAWPLFDGCVATPSTDLSQAGHATANRQARPKAGQMSKKGHVELRPRWPGPNQTHIAL